MAMPRLERDLARAVTRRTLDAVELKDVAIKPAPWRVYKHYKPFEMKCDHVRGTASGSIAPASCL